MNTFTKRNSTLFDDSLLMEAQGLELLRQTLLENEISELSIPDLIEVNEQKLVLQSIQQSSPDPEQMALLGKGLAALHRIQFEHFGLEQNNFIGLNRQINGLSDNWGQFFMDQRLSFQVKLIKDRQIRSEFESILESTYKTLAAFLNETSLHPSLVHGDLWSGNVLFDQERVWLIDPAVYFADREVDIAMSEMFGGFSPNFYQAYQETYPLSPHYPVKKDIYNLYHYLNHYNLFGESYLVGCEKGMQKILKL